MMGLYSAALALALLLSSPWWLTRMLTTERYREGMRERLGRVPQRLRETVSIFAAQRRVIWVHAVSVGEVLAASRLVPELEAAITAGGEPWRVVVSTTTRTGQALARERFGAERVFYFPLDFAWAVRSYLRALNPAALVLMESELWPRVLVECRRANVPVIVVNARVSDRSFARAMRVRAVWARVLRRPALWLAQSDEDARRLVAIGAPSDSVRAIGNLKYDIRAPNESRVAELIKQAAAGRPILVGGSTLGKNPPEDSPLIRAQQSMPPHKRPLLVLAPRHPENFHLVYSMAIEYPTARATELLGGSYTSARPDIIVLDTIGDLAAVYGVADLAFVGGSLVKRGGHNPLEPAQFGVPVVMGPSYENFRGIVTAMRSAEAISISGWSCAASINKENVASPLSTAFIEDIQGLLANPEAARAMGERGRKVFEEQQGATGRAVEAIVALIHAGARP
ncbi:MAG TPA: glycosyltransferase N-terminal domain-containing protein [Acidobacteriaceae bacterium]|jgi:3-deoxy-D-manno-octulosonic-acid transferase